MSETVLQTIALTRSYRVGGTTINALENVHLQVEQGEFVAIMGPSGCGKSTLLNLLGGLDQPSSGRVHIAGCDLLNLSDEEMASLRRKTVGFVFQRHDLFPFLTAQENVEFPLLLHGTTPTHRHKKAQELLARVGLADKANHLPDELSGGQQQRIGIARALANEPLILLADEPTGNLDSATASEILDIFTTLVHDQNLTLVMVTHVLEDAQRSERIIHLRDGHIVQETQTHGKGSAV